MKITDILAVHCSVYTWKYCHRFNNFAGHAHGLSISTSQPPVKVSCTKILDINGYTQIDAYGINGCIVHVYMHGCVHGE